jgi:acetyl-CoA carboxylase carboxyl transferase subunit beta
MQEGTSALIQMQVVAAAIAGARQAGIPHIAIAGDPTTGGVWSSLVASADVVIGVPGARVSFSGSRTRPAGADPESPDFLADGHWAAGSIDALPPAHRLRDEIAVIVRLLSPRSRGDIPDGAPLPAWPAGDGTEGRPGQDAWAQVRAARSPGRVRADQWLAGYFEQSFEIRGDRCGGVDPGLRCGFGRRDGATIAYIAQTGHRTPPAGFRTATRLLGLASRFGRPVLTLIDTPGAAAAPGDEAAGLGPAIAELLIAVASARVPVTSVVIGEGVSGGAIALASPTGLWMARDGYLAVTAPELAAAILKRPAGDVPEVAARLRLTPAELRSRGIIRGTVDPPTLRLRDGARRVDGLAADDGQVGADGRDAVLGHAEVVLAEDGQVGAGAGPQMAPVSFLEAQPGAAGRVPLQRLRAGRQMLARAVAGAVE